MYFDFLRVAAGVIPVSVANPESNAESIVTLATELAGKGAELIVFPELSVTGYTCGDLFHNRMLLEASKKALSRIARQTASLTSVIVVGTPFVVDNQAYNCAAVIRGGKLMAVVPKTYLPDYDEFYEKRWWSAPTEATPRSVSFEGEDVPFGTDLLVELDGVKIGVEICEDLWAPLPPSTHLALAGAEVIVNLSASNDNVGKYGYLMDLIRQQSARLVAGYVYSGAGFGESTTDVVFDGKAVVAENGSLLCRNERWQRGFQSAVADIDMEAIRRDRMHKKTFFDCASREVRKPVRVIDLGGTPASQSGTEPLLRKIDPMPFVPAHDDHLDERCTEIINIQMLGLAKRLEVTGCKSLVIGVSGGLDSTLALLVAAHTFDLLGLPRKGIVAVTMPGFGTTERTHTNASDLMEQLGVTVREISIVPAVTQHFKDIDHDPSNHDITYENSQARQRTYLLMDIANQVNGMVLGTGDLSELALGWATYNGDHMSMYGINASIPKTLIRSLVLWFAQRSTSPAERRTLTDIADTPISPELIPANTDGTIKQKTEDAVGPYELHDFFLYHTLRYGRRPAKIYYLAQHAFADRYSNETILHWMRTFYRRFFTQQFKRSCMPDGPKVGSVCLSPRGDWRMPSDASSRVWLDEVDSLRAHFPISVKNRVAYLGAGFVL
ncbi:MAG: NAD(+) synthase [Muribaculaceae bacterium]|nr:NAD(+) synthase [Muribaculaceae bacterium]